MKVSWINEQRSEQGNEWSRYLQVVSCPPQWVTVSPHPGCSTLYGARCFVRLAGFFSHGTDSLFGSLGDSLTVPKLLSFLGLLNFQAETDSKQDALHSEHVSNPKALGPPRG